jgi:hypothetical protein
LQSSNATRDKVEKLRVVGTPFFSVVTLNVFSEIDRSLRELAVWVLRAAHFCPPKEENCAKLITALCQAAKIQKGRRKKVQQRRDR